MYKKVYLGIDTAYVNCGFTLILSDFSKVISFNSKNIDASYKEFDFDGSMFKETDSPLYKGIFLGQQQDTEEQPNFIKIFYIYALTKFISTCFQPQLVVMESPAFGSSFNTFTLGATYGVVENTLFSEDVSYLYVPPNSIKYAIGGKAKDVNKREIIKALKENFGLSFKDSNMADSAVMALFAYHLDRKVLGDSKVNSCYFDDVCFSKHYGSSKSLGWIYKAASLLTVNSDKRTLYSSYINKLGGI